MYIMECLKDHIALKLFSLSSSSENISLNDDTKEHVLNEFAGKYTLTKRETDVVTLIFYGKTSEEICNSLYITDSTFRKHLYNIYRKANVTSKIELLNLLNQHYFYSGKSKPPA